MLDRRFWRKVRIILDRSSCWLWQGRVRRQLGIFTRGHNVDQDTCRRYVLKTIKKPPDLTKDDMAQSTCRNGLCCRPGHIFHTKKQMPQGRPFSPGNVPPTQRFFEKDCERICAAFESGMPISEIARKENCDRKTIKNIIARATT